jgi:capsular exopolysaccharide synthesis family protein
MLREEASADRRFIADLQARLKNIQLNEKAPAGVQVVSQPYAPQSKNRKMKFVMAGMGFMGALGLGLLYGVARELLDQQVRTRQDIARITDLPTVASIPHLSEDRLLADADSALLMAEHPNTTIADEYRRIIARILFPEDNAAEISSLLVVSASTQEGKTSVATNLAIALEQANRRVLLIDLSSQKPDVERKFGLLPGTGLSELMQNPHAREELIRSTAYENLGVVGPGSAPERLAGRLASREMMDFMEWADEHFDHIIVDTPPLLLMSDAKLLAPAMDGVLFVVGACSSTLGMVSRCLNDLEQLRANVIGVVINGIRSMRGGYLRKNQSLYYAYTERANESVVAGVMPEINVLDEEVPEPVDAEVVLLPYEDEKD